MWSIEFSIKRNMVYYYNMRICESVWEKPSTGTILKRASENPVKPDRQEVETETMPGQSQSSRYKQ